MGDLTILDMRLDISDREIEQRIKLLNAMTPAEREAYIARLHGAHRKADIAAYAERCRQLGERHAREAKALMREAKKRRAAKGGAGG